MSAIILPRVFVQGSDAQINGRIYNWDRPAVYMLPDDVESATYTIVLTDTETFLVQDEELDPADIFLDELAGAGKSDPARWRVDGKGYNLSHNIPGCKFTECGNVQYELLLIGVEGQQDIIIATNRIVKSYSDFPACEGSGS